MGEIKEKIADLMQNSSLKEIDFDDGIKRFNQNPQLFAIILKSFAKNIPNSIEKIPEKITAENASDYSTLIHGIKGSCYGISAKSIGDEAQFLEMAGKSGDFGFIEREGAVFKRKLVDFTERLAEFVKNIDEKTAQNDGRNTKLAPDREILQKLLDAAEIYDLEEIEKAVEALSKFKYEKDGDKIEQIKQKSVEFDYGGLCKVIRKMLN